MPRVDLDAPPTSLREFRERWRRYRSVNRALQWAHLVSFATQLAILFSKHAGWADWLFWGVFVFGMACAALSWQRGKAWDRFLVDDLERTRRLLKRGRHWDLLAEFNREFPPR